MGPAAAKKLVQRHARSCRRCQLASVALLLQLQPSSLSFSFVFLFGWSVSQVLVCIGSRLQAASMAGWLAGLLAGAMELDPTGSSNGAVANHGVYGVDQQRGNVECITLSESFVVSSGIL
jgi:hypothetical protein